MGTHAEEQASITKNAHYAILIHVVGNELDTKESSEELMNLLEVTKAHPIRLIVCEKDISAQAWTKLSAENNLFICSETDRDKAFLRMRDIFMFMKRESHIFYDDYF